VAFSAVPAQAAAEGPTAATCVSNAGERQFKTDHCVPGETGAAFGQVEITEETHAKFSNAKTNATTTGPTNTLFKETIAATNLELESTGVVEGLGTLKNEEVGGVMQASAASDANGITFNGVIVKAPAGQGCVVREKESGTLGVVKTKPIKGHTTVVTDKENGEGTAAERHSVILEPSSGSVFATFWIECTGSVPAALKGNWEITGTITCPTRGATINCNDNTITEANTLKGKGAKAGLQGKATITAGNFPTTKEKEEGKTPQTNPISVTTGPVQPPTSEQTAFLCAESAVAKDFSSAHCVPGETGTKFGHVPITEELEASFSNADTNATTNGPTGAVLKQTIAGINVEVKANGSIEGLGTLQNEEVSAAMQASATTDSNGITFNGVEVVAPGGEGCKVFEDNGGVKGTEGVVKTKPLTARTVATEAQDEVRIQPVTSNVVTTFFVECTPGNVPAELEGTWEVTGSISCPLHGATVVCEHGSITAQNTLKAKGFKAGISGKATVKAAKQSTTPISVTTAQGGASGLEAFTCSRSAGERQFASSHCVPGETGTAFGHVAITEETQAKLSHEKTNATTTGPTNGILKETIAGTNLELESTGVVEGLGTLKNEEVGGVMQAGTKGQITFNGVIVKSPAGQGCVVRESSGGTLGVVKTKPIKGHTTVVTDKENGEGTAAERHSVILEPSSGTVFATFWIECTGSVPPALQGNWEITGTITCPTHGATIGCNHTTLTEQNTLKGKGSKAGLQGKATITAGKSPEGEPKDPVSVTTTRR
jgi:hypothetical protein